MAINDRDMQNLEEHLGKEWAEWVANAAESQGKALEDAGFKFKAPPFPKKPEDDEDEDEEIDMEEKSTISKSELLLFTGLKEASNMVLAAQKEIASLRKQVGDLSNQIEQLQNNQGNTTDGIRRMNQYFGQLTKRMPASQSEDTLYNGGDPNIDEVVKKNHEAHAAPKPVFNQMKESGSQFLPE